MGDWQLCVLQKTKCSCRSAVMADLPSGRLQVNEPPFSHVGIDCFGPFLVKQGRSQVKRYGCIFTCLSMRAVHLEVAHNLTADSFLQALRRFISHRGKPQQIYSDNGTNFVGAQKILQDSLQLWNQSQIHDYFRQHEVRWSFNPPAASHMGGAWERLIRSTRHILCALMKEQVVTDEVLNTLMTEIESILNSRPRPKFAFKQISTGLACKVILLVSADHVMCVRR